MVQHPKLSDVLPIMTFVSSLKGFVLSRYFNYLQICHSQDTSFSIFEVIFHRKKYVKYTTLVIFRSIEIL